MAGSEASVGRRLAHIAAFVIAGLLVWASVNQVRSLVGYLMAVDAAADFAETTADIRSVDLKTVDNGDGSSHELSVTYVYRHQGVERLGHRVELVDQPALVPKWAQQTAERLEAAQQKGQSVPCYVDLAEPDNAVLDRRLRYTVVTARLVAAVLLSAAGLGLFIGMAWWARSSRQLDERKQEFPGQPWMWNAVWASGRLTSSNRGLLITLAVIATVWNVAVTPLALGIHRELGGAGRFGTVGGVITGIGVLLAWVAVNQVRLWFKYGVSEFQMASVPGVLGGPLGGVIHVRAGLAPPEGFEARLSCLQASKGDDRSDKVVWQDQAMIRETLDARDARRVGVPVYFAIPIDCEPTSSNTSGSTTSWRLDLRRGMELPFASFTVPVFRTPESSSNYHGDQELLAQQSPEYGSGSDKLRAVGIEVTPTLKGWRITGSMPFGIGTLTVLLAVLGVCLGLVVFFMSSGWHWGWSVAPALFGALVAYALAEYALWGSRWELEGHRVTIEAGFRPWRKSRSWETLSAIRSVGLDHEYSSNDQQFYRVVVRIGDEKIAIAKRVPSRRAAEAAAAELNKIVDEARLRQAELAGTTSEESPRAVHGD